MRAQVKGRFAKARSEPVFT